MASKAEPAGKVDLSKSLMAFVGIPHEEVQRAHADPVGYLVELRKSLEPGLTHGLIRTAADYALAVYEFNKAASTLARTRAALELIVGPLGQGAPA